MKYYNIGLTDELKVIGHYPQTERSKMGGYPVDAFNSERKVERFEFPEFMPRFGIDLHLKGFATDLLDRTSALDFGLVVNEKLKYILEQFKLPPHRFYPIDVYNTDKKYYWFHYITDFEAYFIASDSEIEVFDNFDFSIIEVLKFTSYDELKEYAKEMVFNIDKSIRFKSIYMTSDFPRYDVLDIQGPQYLTLFSEELKQRLEKEKITGLEYSEYNKIHISLENVDTRNG